MNSVKDRIILFIQHIGLSVRRFEQHANLSNGAVSKMGNNPRASIVENIIEAFPQLNREWLLTGEGEMYADQTSIVQSGYEIPLLDLDASAGFSSVDALGDNSRRTLTLPKCDGAITIVGKSMDPTIHDGDIAVFDMVNSPSSIRPDGIYIVQYTDEDNDVHLTVKRVKRSPEGKSYIRLSADNPEYGYEDVPLKSISRVAKVLYTITKLSY